MKLAELFENDDLVEKMKTDCSVFIKRLLADEIRPLYRGMTQKLGEEKPDIKQGFVRTDRKTRNTDPNKTKLLNAIYYNMTNIVDLRSKCAFIANSENVATWYGRVYYFIPKNDAKFIASKGTHDSITLYTVGLQYYLDGLSLEEAIKTAQYEDDNFEVNRIKETYKYINQLKIYDVNTLDTFDRYNSTEYIVYNTTDYYLIDLPNLDDKYNQSLKQYLSQL